MLCDDKMKGYKIFQSIILYNFNHYDLFLLIRNKK